MALQDILMDGETIELKTRPHWRFIIAGLCVAAVCIPLWLMLSNKFYEWFGDNAKYPNIIVGIVALFILARWTLKPLLQWASTVYVVTNHRVMTRWGILSRHASDIPLDHISNVNYNQSLFDRILKCGSVVLDSTGGDGFTLDNVPHVEPIVKTIQQLRRGEGQPGYMQQPYRQAPTQPNVNQTQPIPRVENPENPTN